MKLPLYFEDLIAQATQLQLYKKLIIQLNKDLLLANIDLEFSEETNPLSLKLVLKDMVLDLLHNKFSDYLNLLYQVDVSEKTVQALDGRDMVLLSEDITFLILQREWQKVWFKSKYS
ncbi:MAG: hypothetical protein HRU49_05785 [Winogradskyella sp.]|uniref:hypothetical protein n=1 Tax=Winogradskyella sp. TaxID=1883156 RepID=UPI0025E1553E|nr:hypothetical protein [Winogradskyella sp.]NRB83266.1 hypothetical protein [Winogradskyella sp.]